MPKIYEISLTPLGPFFFGGEVVFGGALSKDERRRSYLVHSQYLPQQTALLGMLREGVLRAHDELITATETTTRDAQIARAAKRVGGVGFTLPETGNGFGCIKALSPLVLREIDSGKTWQPQPMDDLPGKNGEKIQWHNAKEGASEHTNGWWLKNFDAKAGLACQFSDGEKSKGLDDLLGSRSRVGVRVTNRSAQGWRRGEDQLDEDDEEGFYRQTFRVSGQSAYAEARLKAHRSNRETELSPPPAPPSNIALVFRVEVEPETCPKFWELNDTTVQLGGERSTFKIFLKEVDGNGLLDGHLREVNYLEDVGVPTGKYQRIVLMSDAYLDPGKVAKMGGFIVGYSQPFRYFKTKLDKVKNFQFLRYDKRLRKAEGKGWDPNSGYDEAGRSQSRKHTLLLRGSVIIAPASPPEKEKEMGAEHIIKHIESHAAYRRIGYNYCKIIK